MYMKLTQRQYEVLKLFANGYTSIEIAAKLNISVRTVETHLGNIRCNLGARNSVNAVAIAIKKGLITLLIVASVVQAVADFYHINAKKPSENKTEISRLMRIRTRRNETARFKLEC